MATKETEKNVSVDELLAAVDNAPVEEAVEEATDMVTSAPMAIVPNAQGEMSFDDKIRLARAATNFQSIWEALKSQPEVKLDVVDIIAMEVDQLDRNTGEVVGKHRSTFLCADGSAWSTTSDAVANTVITMRAIFGAPSTWEHPIPLTFVKSESKNGNPFVNILF